MTFLTTIITDDLGRRVCHPDDAHEPATASVVLTNGNYGNAWQRHGNDGLWHSTTGGKRRWSQLLRMRNLVLVYEAPERVNPTGREPVGSGTGWRGATSGRMVTDGSRITEVER